MATSPTYLKLSWTSLPDEFFKTITFEELQVGDRFIKLPVPGDNDGRGGFREMQYIFVKKDTDVPKEALPDEPYSIPHGIGVEESRGVVDHFPHAQLVVRVR